MSTYWVPLGAGPRVTYGTTPPANPIDGDIWYLPVDVTNGVVWTFRYNSGSASSYKWEFVGGPNWAKSYGGGDALAVTGTVTDLPNGPSITIPRAGDYIVTLSMTAAGVPIAHITNFDAGIGSGVGGFWAGPTVAGNTVSQWASAVGQATIAASTVLRPRISSATAQTWNFGGRTISVQPVRIS